MNKNLFRYYKNLGITSVEDIQNWRARNYIIRVKISFVKDYVVKSELHLTRMMLIDFL